MNLKKQAYFNTGGSFILVCFFSFCKRFKYKIERNMNIVIHIQALYTSTQTNCKLSPKTFIQTGSCFYSFCKMCHEIF
jgi:hypothetical protein